MQYFLSPNNLLHIVEIQTLAASMDCAAFIEHVKNNYSYRINNNLIDFDYKSLTCTINVSTSCLCGLFDIWDDEGNPIDTFYCQFVPFKHDHKNTFKSILYEKVSKAFKQCDEGNTIDLRLYIDNNNVCDGIYSIFEMESLCNVINNIDNKDWFIDFYENIKDANSAEFMDIVIFKNDIVEL